MKRQVQGSKRRKSKKAKYIWAIAVLFGGALSVFILFYLSIHDEFIKNRASNIQKIDYYYYLINQKVSPDSQHVKSAALRTHFLTESVNLNTIIYDINKEKIGTLAQEHRDIVGLHKVSKHFIHALLVTEDRDFYTHNGISYRSILRAFIRNILAFRIIEGGSTITQQLAKVLFTDRERNFTRKLYEMMLAWEIEERYDKNDILLMYINYIHFGHNTDGIAEASRFYFNKQAENLNVAESAFLAGLISNPSLYSPFKNPEIAKARHFKILYSMAEENHVNPQHYKQIYKDFWKAYTFQKYQNIEKYKESNNLAPYVIEEVKRQATQYFKQEFQVSQEQAYNFLYTKGFKIYTSIDLRMQKAATDTVQTHLDTFRKTLKKHKQLRTELDGIQGALIAIEPSSGYIKALVGGYKFHAENQYNRVMQAKRQPGSAFKPFVYLAALEEQFVGPYDLRIDHQQAIQLKNGQYWHVKNYNNQYLNEKITLTHALKISSNQIVAQLINEIGVRPVRTLVRLALGLSEDEAFNLYPDGQYSIALGTTVMTPYDLAQLYSMIANQGKRSIPKLILKITTANGEIITPKHFGASDGMRVVSAESSYQITQMLQQVLQPGGTGYRAQINSGLKVQLAGKTGTSQQSRDLWFAGFSPELTTVVWLGHDKDYPLTGGGGNIAAPLFGDFLHTVSQLEGVRFSSFAINTSYHFRYENICAVTGKIAIEGSCGNILYNRPFQHGTEPSTYCPLRYPHTRTTDIQKAPDTKTPPNVSTDHIEEDIQIFENSIEELNDLEDPEEQSTSQKPPHLIGTVEQQ